MNASPVSVDDDQFDPAIVQNFRAVAAHDRRIKRLEFIKAPVLGKVLTIIGSVLAFGWAGLHVGKVYVQANAYSRPRPLAWESQLCGLVCGLVVGVSLSVGLIWLFATPRKDL